MQRGALTERYQAQVLCHRALERHGIVGGGAHGIGLLLPREVGLSRGQAGLEWGVGSWVPVELASEGTLNRGDLRV